MLLKVILKSLQEWRIFHFLHRGSADTVFAENRLQNYGDDFVFRNLVFGLKKYVITSLSFHV